jgi:hypothetical protein
VPTENSVPPAELPSSRRLLRSTAIALAVAAAILVTMVLPAEYGVDPTGVGRILGLTEMGETKMALAREEAGHAAEEATSVPPPSTLPAEPAAATTAPQPSGDSTAKSDVTEVVLSPNEGKEIKLVMRKGTRVSYSWATNRGAVNYDTHGDSPTLKYHGYGKGSGRPSDEGTLVAAFDGNHGWFWRNRGRDTVVVTLRTNGDYQELTRMP